MSVLDEALAEAQLQRGGKCSVAKAIALLQDGPSKGERGTLTLKAFDELLGSALEGSVVARYVQARGLDVAEAAVNRHRRRFCKCP